MGDNSVTYDISGAATESRNDGAAARRSADLKALFLIDSASGVVSYRGGGEDYEMTASIDLPITATSNGQSATATVTINITDVVEDAPPAFTQSNYVIELVENQNGSSSPIPLNTTDPTRPIKATDPDASDTVTYSISLTAATEIRRDGTVARRSVDLKELFLIDSANGDVSYKGGGENFDTTNIIVLPITATSNGQSAAATVTIIIVDAETRMLQLAILEDSDSPGGMNNTDGIAVTADQLAMFFNHVNTYIETRYQDAIMAKTDFSNPPTLAQVQELIDEESADLSQLYVNMRTFNNDISDMDTSGATNMFGMFSGARAFNQPIGDWDVSNVTNMQEMFFTASAFNQDIGDWEVGKVTNMVQMFDNVELTTRNYDSLLAGWARRARVNDTGDGPDCSFLNEHHCFHGGNSKYSHASAREYWISKGWAISDGGVADNVTEGTANADTGSAPGNPLDKSTETGAQILHGLAGADVITGGSANDIIHGGAGNDTIDGGSGADEIHGAAGDDTLSGGLGADTFVFGYPNAGNDTITDFTTSRDKIDISLLLEGYVAGSSTLSNFVTATTARGTTTLTIDPNGDGTTTDQVTIILSGVSTTVEALVASGNLLLE